MGTTDPNPVHVEVDDNGVLHLQGFGAHPDPICAECGHPIRLVLDVTSFAFGTDHQLVHARCLWRPEVLNEQSRLAAEFVVEEEIREAMQLPRRRPSRVWTRAPAR